MQGKIEITNDLHMTKTQNKDQGPNIFMGDFEIRTGDCITNMRMNSNVMISIKPEVVEFKKNVTVEGNLTVNNEMILNGNATVNGTLDFTNAEYGLAAFQRLGTIVKLSPYLENYTANFQISSPYTQSEISLYPSGNCPFSIITDSGTKSVRMIAVNAESIEMRCGSQLSAKITDKEGNAQFPGRITAANMTATSTIDTAHTYARYHYIRPESGNRKNLLMYVTSYGSLNIRDDNVSPAKFTTLYYGSQTVTHRTNLTGELGAFCQANGNIYDGYERVTNVDCICAVEQANNLNKKIVGIICSEDEFASHGDVLVKINKDSLNELEIGDILAPDANGYGKKASETDLMFMMLHAIPRPKITSLDPGIEGYVACFLV
jgi:hypothetical protein